MTAHGNDIGKSKGERRGGDRREGDRRKADLPYDGPERRKHERRSGEDRRD
ncbi:hypothetical protein LY632_04055 [Erythrobacter sp. SDW2]|uniref:hypothetical protein n=1 Tax=Erythrobacter sp. SDW2 TaxID=2907154 RepID=UPI001F454DD2|nr:hypothetical protein [Erythrobacter sp. SDW2]UIP07583.1 hypothetical protein LY632_04055 [Erythrobacter sp. SDW2]